MTKEVIAQIFKQYHGEEFDIHGLMVSLVDVSLISERYGFHFKFKNPNDISYYDGIVVSKLEDMVNEFILYLPIEKYSVHLILDKTQEEVYFNHNIKSEIKDFYDRIPYLSFKVWVGSGSKPDEYKIYGKSEGVGVLNSSDGYDVANKFKVLNATLNGEPISTQRAISEYGAFLEGEATYWETDNVYVKMDDILSNYPLLWDSSWLLIYYFTKFV
jgi:hypothetical protein